MAEPKPPGLKSTQPENTIIYLPHNTRFGQKTPRNGLGRGVSKMSGGV